MDAGFKVLNVLGNSMVLMLGTWKVEDERTERTAAPPVLKY